MLWFAVQSLVGLFLAFLLGLTIGYLIWRLHYRRVKELVRDGDSTTTTSTVTTSQRNASGKVIAAESSRVGAVSAKADLADVSVTSDHATSSRLRKLEADLAEREQTILGLRRETETLKVSAASAVKPLADNVSPAQSVAVGVGGAAAAATVALELSRNKETALAKELAQLREELAAAKRDLTSHDAQRTEYDEELKASRQRVAWLEQANATLTTSVEKEKAAAIQFSSAANQADSATSTQLAAAIAELSALKASAGGTKTELERAKLELDKSASELARLREENRVSAQNLARVSTGANSDLEKLRKEADDNIEKLKLRDAELERVNLLLSQHKSAVQGSQNEVVKLVSDHDTHVADLRRQHESQLGLLRTQLQQSNKTGATDTATRLAQAQATFDEALAAERATHTTQLANIGAQLDGVRSQHHAELETVKSQHSAQINELLARHNDEAARSKLEFETSIANALSSHKRDLTAAEHAKTAALDAAARDHEASLAKATEAHIADLAAKKRENDDALASLRAEHQAALNLARDGSVAALASLGSEHDSALAKLREENAAELAKRVSEHERQLTLRAQTLAQRETELSTLEQRRDHLIRDNAELSGRIDQLSSKAQIDAQDHDRALSDLRRRAELAEAHLANSRLDLERSRAEIDSHKEALNGHQKSLRENQGQIAAHVAELVALRSSFDSHKAAAAAAIDERDHHANSLTANLESQTTENTALRENLSFNETEVLRLRQRVSELELTVASYAQNLAKRESEFTDLRTDHDGKVREISMLRSQVSRTDDDLKKIEGLGPVFDEALRADGIDTFAKLRDADHDRLRRAIEKAGLNFAPSLPTWSRQAAYLAVGDEAGFRSYTERLVAGEDPNQIEAPAPRSNLLQTQSERPVERRATVREFNDYNFDGNPYGTDPVGISDNLQVVEGVGPKIEAALNEVGIRTYRRLAIAPEERLRGALDRSNLKIASSLPTWPRQAKLLLDGDHAGFRALVEKLIAGREGR